MAKFFQFNEKVTGKMDKPKGIFFDVCGFKLVCVGHEHAWVVSFSSYKRCIRELAGHGEEW